MSTRKVPTRKQTHQLGPEAPAAAAGDVTRGFVREQGDSREGGDEEDGEE